MVMQNSLKDSFCILEFNLETFDLWTHFELYLYTPWCLCKGCIQQIKYYRNKVILIDASCNLRLNFEYMYFGILFVNLCLAIWFINTGLIHWLNINKYIQFILFTDIFNDFGQSKHF